MKSVSYVEKQHQNFYVAVWVKQRVFEELIILG